MKKSSLFGLISLVLVSIVGYLVWSNRYQVYDYVRLYNYNPPSQIAELSNNSGMNDLGQRIFYVNDPAIADQSTFNQKCPQKEQSIVLGCYNGREIFIYNVTEPQLAGVKEVTAAHEMLHAAYDRLSNKDRQKVDNLLLQTYNNLQDQRIRNIIETYRKDDPTIVNNELHSILATEIRNLPPELEQYYQKYFKDRSRVVSYSENYEAVFTEAKSQSDQILGDLALRKAEIERLESDIQQLSNTLEQDKANLYRHEQSGDYSAYNNLVPKYNQTVQEYNKSVNQLKKLIEDYNSLVAKYNSLVGYTQQLINSIDSKYQQL